MAKKKPVKLFSDLPVTRKTKRLAVAFEKRDRANALKEEADALVEQANAIAAPILAELDTSVLLPGSGTLSHIPETMAPSFNRGLLRDHLTGNLGLSPQDVEDAFTAASPEKERAESVRYNPEK